MDGRLDQWKRTTRPDQTVSAGRTDPRRLAGRYEIGKAHGGLPRRSAWEAEEGAFCIQVINLRERRAKGSLPAPHRPPESRSGALPVSEAARTFDPRLRTHHKLWSDWVLWSKRSVTGSERSNCMWLARRPDFGAVSGSIRAQSVPGPEHVNKKGLP